MSRYDDNTAAGMALSQEESMYLTPAASPTFPSLEDKENQPLTRDDIKIEDDIVKYSFPSPGNNSAHDLIPQAARSDNDMVVPCDTPVTVTNTGIANSHPSVHKEAQGIRSVNAPDGRAAETMSKRDNTTPGSIPEGLAKVDLEMDRSSQVKMWDFTNKSLSHRTPSAMLQPYAKFKGTQQSGHNTYNVEVTILTVNMPQSNISGFLKISNLTPEHPELETFFTGEIVGGPNQRYSFRTTDPAWGTSETVDMLHWMRFPAWRQFSSIAKRDMGFEYPLNGQAWYQQEHIYMRWKERFLAPDHRRSNLSGASFEGFYYICLNQMEGKISGVYFHSKSERYQQLELSHETRIELGVLGIGGSPLVEMR